MAVVLYQGKVLTKNGKIAVSTDCCCGQQPCCIFSTNCTITVTVSYSNGQTRTNGELEIGYDGNDLATTIDYTIIDCNVVRFSHETLPWIGPGQLFECFQVAVKEQKVNCTTCCEDGTACDCTIGDVVAESYEPFGGLGDCSNQPTTVHVTGISITLANCGECPCNPLP